MGDHELCAAFYLPASDVDEREWATGTVGKLGVRVWADPYGDLLAEWGGRICTVEVVDAQPYRVLALVFDQYEFAASIGDGTADWESDGAAALARAFREACDVLRPPVGFVTSQQVVDLAGFLAEYAGHVHANDVPTLLRSGFGLVYVKDPESAVDTLLGYDPRDEIPVAEGRLVFAGTGPGRWWG